MTWDPAESLASVGHSAEHESLNEHAFNADRDTIGFGQARSNQTNIDGMYAVSDGLKKTSMVQGAVYILSFTEHASSTTWILDDPSGWVQYTSRGPNPNFNLTKPAGAWLWLPEGVYAWQGWIHLVGTQSGSSRAEIELVHEGEWYSEVYYTPRNPMQWEPGGGTGYRDSPLSGGYTDYIQGMLLARSGGIPVVMFVKCSSVTGAQNLDAAWMQITRIA